MGIIPTRVGTSWIAVINQAVNEDHPHACGDKCLLTLFKFFVQGSSPRVWGQETTKTAPQGTFGIIPTRVGTSSAFALSVKYLEDHPHACGDKKLSYRFHKKGVGSSPRVWGQAHFHFLFFYPTRIIPTRVGTS